MLTPCREAATNKRLRINSHSQCWIDHWRRERAASLRVSHREGERACFVGIYEPLQLYITILPLMSCLLGLGQHATGWRSGWLRNYGWQWRNCKLDLYRQT